MAAPCQPRSASIITRVRTTPQGLRCADWGGSVLTARPGLRGIGAAIHGMAEKIRLRLLRYGHLCQPAIYGGSRSRSACGNTKGSHRAQPHPCLAEPIHLTYQRMRTWALGIALVVFRQEVFDDFLSHEPVILRRSGRMDLDNRPIGPPTRVSGGLTARGTVQTVACKNCGH